MRRFGLMYPPWEQERGRDGKGRAPSHLLAAPRPTAQARGPGDPQAAPSGSTENHRFPAIRAAGCRPGGPDGLKPGVHKGEPGVREVEPTVRGRTTRSAGRGRGGFSRALGRRIPHDLG